MSSTEDKSTSTSSASCRDIYGSFSLSGVEFAISVKSIQEVVNEPDEFKPVPLSPDYLLGLFNLRGMIIPVVDLAKIFKFETHQSTVERRIAIIEHGSLCVGILFDHTCEVFNGNDVERSEFSENSRGIKEKVIQGVFKLDEGSRIIQILNPFELLNIEELPKTEASVASNFEKRRTGKRQQCISFQVGDSICGLGIEAIQEIVKVDKIDTTVLSGDICLGAISIRGNTIPIINFEKVLGYESTFSGSEELTGNFRVVIMKLDEELFGLLVNSVESIISFFADEVVQFPVLSKSKREMFKGCITQEDKSETILLEHSAILSHSEVDRITKGHSSLYKEKSSQQKELNLQSSEKRTFITFDIENKYAVDISEVKEVLDFPEEILTPPNLSKNFRGVFNLRGDLIPILDPREIYKMENSEKPKQPKLLIFEINGVKCGFVVDAVNSIVSFQKSEQTLLPEMIYRGPNGSLSEDVKSAVQLNRGQEDETTLLILNVASIASRVSLKAA